MGGTQNDPPEVGGRTTWFARGSRVALWCFVGAALLGAAPKKPGIYVGVTGLRNGRGSVRCALYADAKGWLDSSPHRGTRAKIEKQKATCVFHDVRPGVYGITVLHDEDDDGEMTKSALGLPEEGYAASRGAVRDGIAAPDWKDARFRYPGGVERLEVHIQYP